MQSKQRNFLFYINLLVLVLALIGYNIWSYCAGYCTVSSLMSLSLPAKFLLAGIVVAVTALLGVRLRNRKLRRAQVCTCGSDMLPEWGYCPACGKQVSND